MTENRRRWRIRVFIILILLALILIPPVRSYTKATGLVLEVLNSSLEPLSFLTPEPAKSTIRLGSTPVDVYRPRGFSRAPSIVAIHGAAPKGKDDERLQEFARALAMAGRRVIVPQLGLRKQRLDSRDLHRIREAIAFAAREEPAGVVGFSYGAGLAIVATAESRASRDDVAFVATVGTYFDLAHIVQGITTGTVPHRGRNVPWKTVSDARDRLAEQLSFFAGSTQGDQLRQAWNDKDSSSLDSDMYSLYRLLDNRDPEEFPALFAAIPGRVLTVLSSLSPSEHLGGIDFPIYAMHDINDQASPPSESALLTSETPAEGSRLFIVEVLDHVDPIKSALSNVDEATKLVSFSGLVLRAQEGWPRP